VPFVDKFSCIGCRAGLLARFSRDPTSRTHWRSSAMAVAWRMSAAVRACSAVYCSSSPMRLMSLPMTVFDFSQCVVLFFLALSSAALEGDLING